MLIEKSDNETMRILLADDHLLLGEIVGDSLKRKFPKSSFRCVATVKELEEAGDKGFALIIVDLELSDGSAIRWLEKRHSTKVLVLSCAVEEAIISKVLSLGINGFVHKEDDPDCLYKAIEAIMDGGYYLSPKVQNLRSKVGRSPDALHKILSPRETDVLKLVGAGLTSGEIASRLGLRASSVSDYKKNLLSKLGLHSTQGLMRFAIERGLTRL